MTIDAQVFPAVPREAIRDLSGSLIREVANAGMGRDDILPF
ncbi:MAG: pyridoxal phosphate-dependent aminotransferase, partial [Hyphomicrobiales bacterium]